MDIPKWVDEETAVEPELATPKPPPLAAQVRELFAGRKWGVPRKIRSPHHAGTGFRPNRTFK